MACGLVRVMASEWREPDNPHLDRELVSTSVVPTEPELLAWVGAFPRVTRMPGGHFIRASVRTPTRDALDAAEREAVSTPATLANAGRPENPPPRRDHPFLTSYVALWDVLSLDDESPLASVLAFLKHDEVRVRHAAEQKLEARPNAFAELTVSMNTLPLPLVARGIAITRAKARPDALERLAATLGQQLIEMIPNAPDRELDIDAVVDLLGKLGPAASSARDALRRLQETDLASRRSTLRAAIERALA